MTHYINLFQQLPHALQNEISAYLGSTVGMSEIQIIEKHRGAALQLKAAKLASIPADAQGYPGHLTVHEFNNMSNADLALVSNPLVEVQRQLLTSEGAWHLDGYASQLSSIHSQMTEAARQHAQRQAEEAARRLARQQAEESARQLARQRAEEAARLHAQRLAEQQAREAEQRRAKAAAELAARQLAEQQAEAAARALIFQRTQEAALREARLAAELVAATHELTPQPPRVRADNESLDDPEEQPPARHLLFMPGPVAAAEIERATFALKCRIDVALSEYAAAIDHCLYKPVLELAGEEARLTP